LVDALVSGTSGASREGSSPFLGTTWAFANVRNCPKTSQNHGVEPELPSKAVRCRSLASAKYVGIDDGISRFRLSEIPTWP
jgi:hypothetical protein